MGCSARHSQVTLTTSLGFPSLSVCQSGMGMTLSSPREKRQGLVIIPTPALRQASYPGQLQSAARVQPRSRSLVLKSER